MRITYAVNITRIGTAFEKHGILKEFVVLMYKLALKKAKVVFFENSENMQLFPNVNITSNNQVKFLNGAGVNLDRYCLMPYPKMAEGTRFLFMGRVMAEKGINELFTDMRKLRKITKTNR